MKVTILRPGGNDQLIIDGIVAKKQKRSINDSMINKFPNVEQVSFYKYNSKTNRARLELAGGEFCGNATRSLAYLILKGKKGQLKIKVSGAKKILNAGVLQNGTAFAQMPINSNLNSVRKISKNLFRVDMQGIVHLICTDQNIPKKKDELKKMGWDILQKENLLYSEPAAGVMFIDPTQKVLNMKPIVWVRDIETILYETGCASGTTAVGMWWTKENNLSEVELNIKQPSGMFIKVKTKKNESKFLKAYIDGPIETLEQKEIQL